MVKAALLTGVFAAASASQDGAAFRSNVELVAVPCTVVDGHGAAVRDLTREEFRVYDNGVRRNLENLWLDADEPLTLGIVIDASESQRERMTEHRETAFEVLDLLLRPGDRVFVISVDEEVRLWADMAGTTAALRRQMARSGGVSLGDPCPKREGHAPGVRATSVCGSSPLWNAIYDAAHLKLRAVKGNKALLILTDGFDSGSTHTLNQAIEESQRADTAVYAIEYPGGFGGRYAPGLYRLAGETGGTWFQPPGTDYAGIVSRMETDLRHRYVLGFRPNSLGFGKLRHELRVEVTRPELRVRARKTYFEAQ